MNRTPQPMLFDLSCSVAGCNSAARPGCLICQRHWKTIPDRLKIRLSMAGQVLERAKSPRAIETARRAFDVARQACVQAVAK